MNRRNHSVHRVVVIGAGVSGLAAARELVQRGYKVVVVEARSRAGGRLKASRLDLGAPSSSPDNKTTEDNVHTNETVLVDMGGALIHGIDENPVATLVQDVLGEATQKVQETLLMTDSGWPVDPRQDERTATTFDETLEEAFKRAKQPNNNNTKANKKSFGAILDAVWQERSVSAADALLQWYKSNLELSCGVGLQRLGLEFNDDEAYGFEGDHVAMTKSWQPVVEALARGMDILYNAQVAKIQVIHPKEYKGSRRKVVAPPPASPNKKNAPKSPIKKKPRALPSTDTTTLATKSTTSLFTAIETPSGTIPLRQSRRLRGEDAVLRRSIRSTKGKFDNRYVVPDETPKNPETTIDQPQNVDIKKKRPRVAAAASEQPVKRDEPPGPTTTTVFVTLQNGKVLEADSVVCTLPLAMLQQRQVDIQPPLSKKKQNAIDSLGGGLLNKVCIATVNLVPLFSLAYVVVCAVCPYLL